MGFTRWELQTIVNAVRIMLLVYKGVDDIFRDRVLLDVGLMSLCLSVALEDIIVWLCPGHDEQQSLGEAVK